MVKTHTCHFVEYCCFKLNINKFDSNLQAFIIVTLSEHIIYQMGQLLNQTTQVHLVCSLLLFF